MKKSPNTTTGTATKPYPQPASRRRTPSIEERGAGAAWLAVAMAKCPPARLSARGDVRDPVRQPFNADETSESIDATDLLPAMTAVRSLFITVYALAKWGLPKPQPCAYGAALRNAWRPPMALTSLREGSARPFDIQIVWPRFEVSQDSRVHAACLFGVSFAIEYETVKARLPPVLSLTIGKTPYWTFGYVDFMNGRSQLPSMIIAALPLPSASPHQPEPSLSGVVARPLFMSPT